MRGKEWAAVVYHDRLRAAYWTAYQVGERVEVDVAALRLRPGAPVLLADGRAGRGAGSWARAVVEGVRSFPGYGGFERYTVRIRDGAFAGTTGEVGVVALRRPSVDNNSPSPYVR